MSIMQFGNFYCDPINIIAIDTKPSLPIPCKDDCYFVYLKENHFITLEGEAARKCFKAFMEVK